MTSNKMHPIVLSLLIIMLIHCGGSGDGFGSDDALPFLPSTTEPPSLNLNIGPIDFSDGNTVSIFPMGLPEGESLSPGEEIEINRADPGEEVTALVSGIVTSVAIVDGNPDNTNVSIRYGENYVVKNFHVSNVPAHIVRGYVIEEGESIGQTQIIDVNGDLQGFWELGIIQHQEGGGCSYVCPYDYFDAAGKEVLDSLLEEFPPDYADPAPPYAWCYEEEVDGSSHCGELN